MKPTAFDSLLGHSATFASVIRAAQIVALTDATVLVLGESGTGKERLAHALHQYSRRATHAFIAINCAALPENLVESALFGHKRGAFTGATTHQSGRIQAAAGGTLFLDEIGELPLTVQAKLLRFLESGECQPIGSVQAEKVNTRIIAATNRDLYQMVQAKLFRADLYYRLNIVPLTLPPLREREHDWELLLQQFTRSLAEQHQCQPPHYERSMLKALKRYTWPGNIRELRNFCERMVILASGQRISAEQLPAEMRAVPAQNINTEFILPEQGLSLGELEKDLILQALHKTHGNRTQAARLLNLSRHTLLYRMKKYAIE